MTIANLISAIPPPHKPTYAFSEPWDLVEGQLGSPLPIDYKELARLYGRGQFLAFFDIYTPKGPTLESRFFDAINIARATFLQEVQGSFIFDDPPLPIWPRPGGLLACGETGWGDYLFWLTRGPVEEWPIVLWSRERQQLESFEYDLTDFLAGVATGEIESASFPGKWSADLGMPAYTPLPPK